MSPTLHFSMWTNVWKRGIHRTLIVRWCSQETKPTWSGVIVGQIEEINPHPQADRLQLCQVNVGGKVQ